jgi:NAD(P)-dependent dehydrogenase (short-subunit alcohol dehydrogenase family)
MQISLRDRVVWVTGGGEGIGRGIALLAAECGGKVALTGRDPEPLEEVAETIKREHNGEAIVALADISKSDEVQQAVAKIHQKWNRLDCVCANAGINGTWAPVETLSPDDWRKTIDVNLTGTYLTIHHSLEHLIASGHGSIVIVSSVNGTRMFSNEGASAYASSKAGQLALGKMLALELAPRKVRVNIICPGAIESNIHEKTEREDLKRIETSVEFPDGKIPLTDGKMGLPSDVANLAVFLLSDTARHITGTPIWIDGAQSLLQG